MTDQTVIDGFAPCQRVCLCGCGRSLADKRSDAVWSSRACAAAWARANPGKSLYAARKAHVARTPKPSGLQVALWKAVDRAIQGFGVSRELAESVLSEALSARQRQRYNERTHA